MVHWCRTIAFLNSSRLGCLRGAQDLHPAEGFGVRLEKPILVIQEMGYFELDWEKYFQLRRGDEEWMNSWFSIFALSQKALSKSIEGAFIVLRQIQIIRWDYSSKARYSHLCLRCQVLMRLFCCCLLRKTGSTRCSLCRFSQFTHRNFFPSISSGLPSALCCSFPYFRSHARPMKHLRRSLSRATGFIARFALPTSFPASCYIRSRSIVRPTKTLGLTIGSEYRQTTVSLQRFQNRNFKLSHRFYQSFNNLSSY